MEHKKIDYKINDGKLEASLDGNQDGEKSLKIVLHLTEAIQELVAKGGKLEGAKVVDFKFELTKLKLKIDTDQDGEELMEIEIDLGESFDELVSKKKDA